MTQIERRLSEVHIRVLYRLLSETLRARELHDVYDAALTALEETLHVRAAAVLLFDNDGVMRFEAWRNLSDQYRAAVEGHSPWKPGDPEVPTPVLVRSVARDPALDALRDVILNEGIRSLAFVPILVRDDLLGKFMIYFSEEHDFTSDEQHLAEIIAGHVAVAIERRKWDEALRTSEERFSKVFKASPVGIAIVRGHDRRFIDANPAFLRILGYEREEIIGNDASEIGLWVHPEDRDRLVHALTNRGMSESSRTRLRAKDGKVREVVGSAEIVSIAGEACVLSLILDVTDERKADDAARYLNAIVEGSADAIVGKTLDGVVKSWNRGAERLFGYTEQEMIGQSIRKIIPADRQHEEDEVLARLRRGERTEHFETVRVRKDGSLVDVSLTVSPIRNRDGRLIGASKIARDLSERRKSERLASQFLSLVSHELRTPLATIYGGSRLLRDRFDRIDPGDRTALLNDLVEESSRLQRIIENLLLLTRLDVRGVELEPVRLERVLQRVVDSFESRNPSTRVRVVSDDSIPLVSANSTFLELVVENLLNNAGKYTPGDAEIDVHVTVADVVEVCVADRGIGVSGDEADRLFKPFYRSEQARSLAAGMGVGLAVCKQVIEAQGGKIWARPRPGGGSEFCFTLMPLETEAE